MTHNNLVPVSFHRLRSENKNCRTEIDVACALRKLGHKVQVVGSGQSLDELNENVENYRPQIIFNLVEEFDDSEKLDQNIAAYFELRKWRFTGCTSLGMTLARDKILAKQIVKSLGFLTPDFIEKKRARVLRIPAHMRFPMFVKSSTEDASRGITRGSLVKNRRQLEGRVDYFHEKWETDVLIEEFVPGTDVYAAAMGHERPLLFPRLQLNFLDESEPDQLFATEKVKWSLREQEKFGAQYAIEVTNTNKDALFRRSLKSIFLNLKLQGYARFDFRRDRQGRYFFLEANPNPDLCREGEFSLGAKFGGFSYTNMIQQLLQNGLRRRL